MAVGFNLSYAVWIISTRSSSANTAFALKGVKFLDDRIVLVILSMMVFKPTM